jgi:hypothetical protein
MALDLIAEIAADSQSLADPPTIVTVYALRRIAYSILTEQSKAAREPVYNQLRDYLQQHPGATLPDTVIPTGLLERVQDGVADELRTLDRLTTAKM